MSKIESTGVTWNTQPGALMPDVLSQDDRYAVVMKEAVRLSGLSRTELYRRLKSGEIEAIKVRSRTLVLMDSLKRLLASLPAWQPRD
ncbi:MAG: hypothetical protein ABSC06_36230 [Rhodopila sp.]|jgi:hypothetical protein